MDKTLMMRYQKYNLKEDYEGLVGEGAVLVKEVLSELKVHQDKYEDCFDIGMVEIVFFIKNFEPECLEFIDMLAKMRIKKQITNYLQEDSKVINFTDLDAKEKIQIYENTIIDTMAKIAKEEKIMELKTFLDTLDTIDREILEDYYNFSGKGELSFEMVAKMHNMSTKEVKKSINTSLSQARYYFKELEKRQ